MTRTIYGFEADLSHHAFPYAELIVRIAHGWKDKTPYLKEMVDMKGGRFVYSADERCTEGRRCLFCAACPTPEERTNVHKFLEEINIYTGRLPLAFKMELARFVNVHRSSLFERRASLRTLPHYLRNMEE